ncbi:MAG: DEAD/DEAH box helicase [Deltaproteobacteria bacterium]|nr:DEAD/DEAH box helicase [Deltaproteobacteria bacterium]
MSEPGAPFSAGDLVRRKSQPDAAGVVVGVDWDEQLEEWTVGVRFGTGIRGLVADMLEAVPETPDAWGDLSSGRAASLGAFRTVMTYERLRKPPSRIAASFGSARAVFLPYQFKPLLKFLENPKQRLLVADDVGLGKTIEAGYILRELRARRHIERVLIVVPARLREKWKRELEQRFDERFEIVGGAELLAFKEIAAGRRDDRFLWITSYESARSKAFVELLEGLEPTIDLVVLDEAHRLRNPRTWQNRLGNALGVCAEAMVLLTATPIQTELANLYHELRALDADTFFDVRAFEELESANRPVVRSLRALRSSPPDFSSALVAIQQLGLHRLTASFLNEPFFRSIAERLSRGSELKRGERVELERDIGELSPTGAYITRTRKREVMRERPQREAQVFSVVLTPEERSVYDLVEQLCREIRPDLDDWALTLYLLTAYRMTASCIPAALEAFRARLELPDVTALTGEIDDAEEDDEERGDTDSVAVGSAERLLLGRLGFAPFPSGLDTKFDRFRDALELVWGYDREESRAPRKVIVFSFFKRTLAYLSRRLDGLEIGFRIITGDVPISEREIRIEEFANDPGAKVLLSSEVGSEGIDLQFASVVVNYDLPWNPMVVEQRIGRIDRIGQEAKRLVIVNLVSKETIEEHILYRLYRRIGIFEDSIGDIDPILGKKLEELTLRALRGELTREEMTRLADETADVVCREERDARRLGDDADGLIAADQAFLDEIQRLAGSRKVPTPEELVVFLNEFFERRYPGTRLPVGIASGLVEVHLPDTLGFDLRAELSGDPATARFAARVENGPFTATFDQTASTRHPRAELFYLRHPIVRFAQVSLHRGRDQMHRTFALRVPSGALDIKPPPPGEYAFAVGLLDLGGVRPRTEIVPVAISMKGGELLTAELAEALYLAALGRGESFLRTPTFSDSVVRQCAEALEGELAKRRSLLTQRERELNEVRSTRRRATVTGIYDSRLRRLEDRLRAHERGEASTRVLKMLRGKIEKARRDAGEAVAQLSACEQLTVESEVIAVGLLEVV